MESIEFVDWEETDFRYAEERIRVAAVIRRLATEKKFSHAKVQQLWMKIRYKAPHRWVTVHFKKKTWVESHISRHVTAMIHFNGDCELEDRVPNPEWKMEEDKD